MEKKALILDHLFFWNKESPCKRTLSKMTVFFKINTVKGTAGSLRFYQLFQVYQVSWIKIRLNTNLPNYTCRSGLLLQYNFWCLKFIVTSKSSGDHLPLHHLWSLPGGLLFSPASWVELLLQAAYLLTSAGTSYKPPLPASHGGTCLVKPQGFHLPPGAAVKARQASCCSPLAVIKGHNIPCMFSTASILSKLLSIIKCIRMHVFI